MGCSPHTRGWTGVVLWRIEAAIGVPRTRGDGPMLEHLEVPLIVGVPRTRGDGPYLTKSGGSSDLVFPAHAGMDR